MSTEIIMPDQRRQAVVPISSDTSIMAVISRPASDPSCDINKLEPRDIMYRVSTRDVGLNLDRWLFVNDARSPRAMSTQLTGCTCYFQTYLFGLLCKVGDVAMGGGGVEVCA